MQPMVGMPGMQMAMPQQMAAMPQQMGQMAMAPMAMGTPMGMMPAMGMVPMGMPMMPMGMMGMSPMGPMMMMPGPMGPSISTPVAPLPVPLSQGLNEEEAVAQMAALLPQKASSASRPRRPRRDGSDSEEEGRGKQALRNVGSAAALSKEAKKTGPSPGASASAEGSGAEASKATESSGNDPPSKRKRCHLHMKPNPSCKVCRRIKDENAALDAGEQSSKSSSKETAEKDDSGKKDREKDEAKQPIFRSSPMLKDQILKSSYFKSLLDITTVEGLIEEIQQYADTLDVYNAGSATIPSCFICQVYRLFTMPNAEDELPVILYSESATARCVGFVYVRYAFDPAQFWSMLEEHLFDDMELKYQDNGGKTVTMTIGEYVEQLLIKEKYFGSPLPRIPVKVRQQLDERLAPLPSYRKRMQANREVFKKAKDMPVEVCIDNGKWLPGKVRELFGRSSTFVKVRVKLEEDGREITSHLGKLVLRDSSPERDDSDGSGDGKSDSDDNKKRKKRQRSRSRRRGKSPDWSRFKGKSQVEMLEELRERAKEDAVSGHGHRPRRPLTFEGFATKFESSEQRQVEGDSRPSYVQPRAAAKKVEGAEEDEITRRLRRQQEDERQRAQQAIFEKYGKQSRPGSSSAYSDVDKADVLRLG